MRVSNAPTGPYHFRLLLIAFWMGCLTQSGAGAPSENENQPGIARIALGFDSIIRIGHWSPARVRLDDALLSRAATLELTTVDSDSVPVTFRWPVHPSADGWISGWVCVGRMSADLRIRVTDVDDRTLAQRYWPRLSHSEFQLVSATDLFLLSIGSPLNLRDVLPTSSRNTTPWQWIHVTDDRALPDNVFAYDSIDLIVVTADRADFFQHWTAAQTTALKDWVSMGGRIVISLGDQADAILGSGAPLEFLAPGPFQSVELIAQSDALEFYARPAAQLLVDGQTLPIVRFESAETNVDVQQGEWPLVTRRAMGLGEVVVIHFDVTQPTVAAWNGRARLLARAMALVDAESAAGVTVNSSAARHGFSDISGQTRAAMERFQRVSVITFTMIAVLIGVYILCIGPGDYYLVRHVFKRMEWTWLTFTLITLAFSGLAWWIVRQSKPSQVQVNECEIIDVDARSGVMRGTVWTNLYSPRTDRFKFSVAAGSILGGRVLDDVTSSFGLPGQGIGGMQSTTETRLFSEPYTIERQSPGDRAENNPDRLRAAAVDVPVAVASTKPMLAKWMGQSDPLDFGQLRFQNRANRLTGRIDNPFDLSFRDCYVLHGNRAYLFKNLPAKGSIDLGSATERTLKVFLQAGSSEVENIRWVTADRNLTRVLQMQMFFTAAGGSKFTGLTNNYQDDLDLSHLLRLGKAILVGQLDQPGDSIVQIEGTESFQFDRNLVTLRAILPVEQVEK